MALEQKLSLKMAQKLVMTPSLQQAIKLLQMTRMELEGVVAQEMMENPVLEEVEAQPDDSPEVEDPLDQNENQELETALDDIDVDAFFGDLESWEGSGQSGGMHEQREAPPIENTLHQEDDLYDHLLWQLHMADVPPIVREIAELIIGNLDPDGFLAATVEEIMAMGAVDYDPHTATVTGEETEEGDDEEGAAPAASEWRPADDSAEVQELATDDSAGDQQESEEAMAEDPVGGYPRELVEEVLEFVRNFDPPGVACCDLRESLLRQLDAREVPEEALARRVISDHWDQFKRRKFEQIAKELSVPLQDLKPVVELVGRLDTRPGRQYDTESAQYVEPEVHVVKVGEDYVIQTNDSGMPRLRVSRAYRKMLRAMREKGSDGDAQQYIKEKMRSALWLIKSLDQRQRTIYKVAKSIVKQQRGFLDHGVEQLKPMVLRDVAEDIEMHESTVSRVVSNKYIHTPRGVLPMKYFFHSGIDREYGGDISSLSVKRKIENLVAEEDSKKPLSDSEIMRILKREGIQIARRTVAKYRDELGIPSSTDRKKIF
ncbi:MAG: RNA polymerase factor sigma-54 [Thermoanaerobaculia bacterium]|nr:RNA polymerase factor sigma-54 [Thermoanaerobaculia bacterium]